MNSELPPNSLPQVQMSAKELRELFNAGGSDGRTPLRFNGHVYYLSVNDGKVEVSREKSSLVSYPLIAKAVMAIGDFFSRWRESGRFCQAFTTRAHTLQAGINTLWVQLPQLTDASCVRFFSDHSRCVLLEPIEGENQARFCDKSDDQSSNKDKINDQSNHQQGNNHAYADQGDKHKDLEQRRPYWFCTSHQMPLCHSKAQETDSDENANDSDGHMVLPRVKQPFACNLPPVKQTEVVACLDDDESLTNLMANLDKICKQTQEDLATQTAAKEQDTLEAKIKHDEACALKPCPAVQTESVAPAPPILSRAMRLKQWLQKIFGSSTP